MTHQVIVLPTAERDLDQILTWLYRRSPQGAKTWLESWDETVLSLADNPERCSLAPESENHPVAIHQVFFRTRKGNPYRALFAIQDGDTAGGQGTSPKPEPTAFGLREFDSKNLLEIRSALSLRAQSLRAHHIVGHIVGKSGDGQETAPPINPQKKPGKTGLLNSADDPGKAEKYTPLGSNQ